MELYQRLALVIPFRNQPTSNTIKCSSFTPVLKTPLADVSCFSQVVASEDASVLKAPVLAGLKAPRRLLLGQLSASCTSLQDTAFSACGYYVFFHLLNAML